MSNFSQNNLAYREGPKCGELISTPLCKLFIATLRFLENQEIIRKILTHLGLYLVRSRPPPRAPPKDFWFDSPYSQVPDSEDYLHTTNRQGVSPLTLLVRANILHTFPLETQLPCLGVRMLGPKLWRM